ncbi:MAG: hypothetical protein Q8M16_13055 [Pirellulaceae bacterium]|nr:hypothetical protein [Pirellulaceae bacterium]
MELGSVNHLANPAVKNLSFQTAGAIPGIPILELLGISTPDIILKHVSGQALGRVDRACFFEKANDANDQMRWVWSKLEIE